MILIDLKANGVTSGRGNKENEIEMHHLDVCKESVRMSQLGDVKD